MELFRLIVSIILFWLLSRVVNCSVPIAAVFGSSSLERLLAERVARFALTSSGNVSLAPALIWFDDGFAYSLDSIANGTFMLQPTSPRQYLDRIVSANPAALFSTACSSSSSPFVLLPVAAQASPTIALPRFFFTGAVCDSHSTSASLTNSASSPPVTVVRMSHSIEAHVRSFVSVINHYNWPRVGILMNGDEFDPQLTFSMLKQYLVSQSSLVIPNVASSDFTKFGVPSSQQHTSYFHSNFSADALELYVSSLRVQRSRVILVFASMDLVPNLVTALQAESLNGMGVALLLCESFLSRELLLAANHGPFVSSTAFFALQGALVIQPTSSFISSEQVSFPNRFMVETRTFDDPGPTAPYLYDGIKTLQRLIEKSGENPSAWSSVLNQTAFTGASGAVSFVSKLPNTWQRPWNGSVLVYNIQVRELVLVAIVDSGAPLKILRSVVWPGNTLTAPSNNLIQLAVEFQGGIVDSEAGALGALMAVDLINWASLDPADDFPAYFSQSQNYYYRDAPTLSITKRILQVPQRIRSLLPRIPRGSVVEVPREYMLDDRCSVETTLQIAERLHNASDSLLAVIGPYCSSATQTLLTPVASPSSPNSFATPVNSSLPFITWGVATSLFHSPTVFPTFARTLVSSQSGFQTLLSFLIKLGIRRCAVVYVDDAYGQSGLKDFTDWAFAYDVIIGERVAVPKNTTASLPVYQNLLTPIKTKNFKAIVTITQGFTLGSIARAAFKLGLYGAGYIFTGLSAAYDNDLLNAIAASPEVRLVTDRMFLVRRDFEATLEANDALHAMFSSLFPKWSNPTIVPSSVSFAFDAVLLAISSYVAMLNNQTAVSMLPQTKTSNEIPSSQSTATMAATLKLADPHILLMNQIRSANVQGVTGTLQYFPHTTDRFGLKRIWNVMQLDASNGQLTEVARIDDFFNVIDVNVSSLQFAGGLSYFEPKCPLGFVSSSLIQACLPCPPGRFALNFSQICQTCAENQFCPLATSYQLMHDSPLIETASNQEVPSNITSNDFVPTPLTMNSIQHTNVWPVQAGQLFSKDQAESLQKTYFYVALGLDFTLLVLGMLVLIMPPGVDVVKDFFRFFDVFFTTNHPTLLGSPIIRRKTMSGGFFSIMFIAISVLGAAFLVHRWSLDQFEIVRLYIPFMILPNLAAPPSDEVYVQVRFVGIDNSYSCSLACASYIRTASMPGENIPFNSQVTSSPWGDREACNESTSISDARDLRCGSTTISTGSRVWLWTEGVMGDFQCSFEELPASTCSIRFQPTIGTVLPSRFAIHFSLPGTRSSAIIWSVRSETFSEFDVGSRGVIFRPQHVLYGPSASELEMALIPWEWIGDSKNAPQYPDYAAGYLSLLLNRTLGSTLNETSAVQHPDLRLSVPQASFRDYPAHASTLSMLFQVPVSGYRFELQPLWPTNSEAAVSLLTQLSALIGSFLFTAVRLSLVLVESFIMWYRNNYGHKGQKLADEHDSSADQARKSDESLQVEMGDISDEPNTNHPVAAPVMHSRFSQIVMPTESKSRRFTQMSADLF